MSFYQKMHTRLLLLALVSLVIASRAFAEGGAGEHHGSIADLSKFWVNFILYIGLLTYLLRKPLVQGWASRRQRIAREVEAATSEMAAAERELAAVEALNKNISHEQQRVRGEILQQGELEASSIMQGAKEKASRVTSQVAELLEGESRSAQATFRAALVSKAVDLAKARFASGDFSSRQSAYVDAAVDRAKRLAR